MESWVALVDGVCYGMFKSHEQAAAFVASDFPVAYNQVRYTIAIFEKVVG